MKRLAISVIGLLILSLGIYSCTKEEVKSNSVLQFKSTSGTSLIYAAGPGDDPLGFGLRTTKGHCEFFPFWLCRGKYDMIWVPTDNPNLNSTIAYTENGNFVLEIYVSPEDMPTITNQISDGFIEMNNTGTGEEFMLIPQSLVQQLSLQTDRINVGIYPASLVSGTNRVKVTF